MGFIFFLPIVLAVFIIILMLLMTAAAAIIIGIGGVVSARYLRVTGEQIFNSWGIRLRGFPK